MKELLDQSCFPLGDVLLVLLLLTKSRTEEDDFVLKVPQRQLKRAGIPLMVVGTLGNQLERMQCLSVVIFDSPFTSPPWSSFLNHHLSEQTSSSPTCREKENLLFLKTSQSKLAMVLTSFAASRKDFLALKTKIKTKPHPPNKGLFSCPAQIVTLSVSHSAEF